MDTSTHRATQAAVSLGFHCVKAAADLPAHGVSSGNQTLFTISRGRIFVTLLLGEVTTVFQNSDPVLTVFADPTSGVDVSLASTVDTSSLQAGGFLIVEGDGSALVKSNAGAAIVPAQHEFIVAEGKIVLDTDATKTGATKWDLYYFPLDEGATVVSG
jgi:hypothetical protein